MGSQEGLDMGLHEELILVDGADAIKTASALSKEEGIFCGISGGATMRTALDVAEKAPQGSTILCMIPDTAERYLSTPLFASIDADMDEAEVEISKSTASAKLEE